jgi:hypothetical protein
MEVTTLSAEIDRQQSYLDRLPDEFDFPLFNVKHAVESQRRSGYRDTAAAAREIVDNAIEAGADRVDIAFDTDLSSGRNSVSAIAFIDNGSGMLPNMLRYALTWGGGSHFDDHAFIGRFGFGLPNSSINQARRVDVYSRLRSADPFYKGVLDITNPSEFGVQQIEEATPSELPKFVQDYIERNQITIDHGTIVVWVRPDRLSYKRPGTLRELLVDDFGVTYRYLLNAGGSRPTGFTLMVQGVDVEPVDPLFLMPEGRLHVPAIEGGAEEVDQVSLAVRYWEDDETGERHLEWIPPDKPESIEEAIERNDTVGAMHVKIARFPVGFAEASAEGDAKKRFEIRKSHRGMTFVRADREIQTVDVFPRSEKDKAAGLGSWPLLQSYAYHWGIEIRFEPALDDAFGITNDKQSVRPIEDFWRVLVDAEIDDKARRENAQQRTMRKKAPELTTPDQPTHAEASAGFADLAADDKPEVPPRAKSEAEGNFEKEAKERAERDQQSEEDARKALAAEAKKRPYKVIYEELPSDVMFEPEWLNAQVIVHVNTKHPLYQVFYGELLKLSGGQRAKDALDLLVIALARAELRVDDEAMAMFVEAQRREVWSPFLRRALQTLASKERLEEDDYGPADTGEEETDISAA